jgi:PhoPQ-activated pathogenicity-related protein
MSSPLTRSRFLVGSLFTATSGLVSTVAAPALGETALDRYVAAPDAHYGYRLVNTLAGDGCTGYVLEMTSQRWREAAEVDQPIWKHWLTIVEPDVVHTNVGALIVSGGSNGDRPASRIDPALAVLAKKTNSVVGELNMVPNQPLTFADEAGARSEDELVAYTWDKYLRTGDERWPLRLPMTKSVVRAMDTVTAFCGSSAGRGVLVDRFVVGGSSKRGWTTWTTAAVDRRVVGIVPIVIDVLNVEPNAEHGYRAYGFWPPALRAYEQMGLMKWMGTPKMDALMQIEDPYSYRARYTMPKFIINATGDQFFPPDSSRYYFGGLPRETYLRYIPNCDHSLKGAAVESGHSVLAFYQSIIDGKPRPKFSWRFDEGAIRVHSVTTPLSVKLWRALNPKARDFRLEAIGKAFTSSYLLDQGNGTFVGEVKRPKRGWAAYLVELTYPSQTSEIGDQFKLTTGVRVTPDVLPFAAPAR